MISTKSNLKRKDFFGKTAAVVISAVICSLLVLPLMGGNINAFDGESVEASASNNLPRLIPLGRTTGIKMFSGGAMIVGFAPCDALGGVSPLEKAGAKVGDIIVSVNDCDIQSNEELVAILGTVRQKTASIGLNRNGSKINVAVESVFDEQTKIFRLGAWVRDSMAGIGTITFVNPDTGAFGALGHGICDVDTGCLMPLNNGSIMHSTVSGAVKGKAGAPGQLMGVFNLRSDSGELLSNTNKGVFGTISDKSLYSEMAAIPVCPLSEVKTGQAYILSNIEGDKVEKYSIEIAKVYKENDGTYRSFMITVTDDTLIGKTGGIVQGMSGSPIIQNGRLIGAVTHVLVNDPLKGYGIGIEHMLEEM